MNALNQVNSSADVQDAFDLTVDMAFENEKPADDATLAISASTFTGAVVSGSSWSETHVSGGGSTGFAVGRFGASSTAAVRSTVMNMTEFWLRRSDGQEERFTVPQKAAEFREGHVVTVISYKKGSSWQPWGVYNHRRRTMTWLAHPVSVWKGLLAIGGVPANLMAWMLYSMATSEMPANRVQNAWGQTEYATNWGAMAFALALFAGNWFYVRLHREGARRRDLIAAIESWFERNRIAAR